MTYSTMKKLILNANAKVQSGAWSVEEYEIYKLAQQNKLDVFFAKGRLTEAQYNELTDLWLVPNKSESETEEN